LYRRLLLLLLLRFVLSLLLSLLLVLRFESFQLGSSSIQFAALCQLFSLCGLEALSFRLNLITDDK
jgi:hypothetical protein